MNTIFILLFCSFIFVGLSAVFYILEHYISEFSRYFKFVTVVFWLSYFSAVVLTVITFVKIVGGAV